MTSQFLIIMSGMRRGLLLLPLLLAACAPKGPLTPDAEFVRLLGFPVRPCAVGGPYATCASFNGSIMELNDHLQATGKFIPITDWESNGQPLNPVLLFRMTSGGGQLGIAYNGESISVVRDHPR